MAGGKRCHIKFFFLESFIYDEPCHYLVDMGIEGRMHEVHTNLVESIFCIWDITVRHSDQDDRSRSELNELTAHCTLWCCLELRTYPVTTAAEGIGNVLKSNKLQHATTDCKVHASGPLCITLL